MYIGYWTLNKYYYYYYYYYYLVAINKQNNDKFQLKTLLLQSGIIPLLFLPTNGLVCKDATHIYIHILK